VSTAGTLGRKKAIHNQVFSVLFCGIGFLLTSAGMSIAPNLSPQYSLSPSGKLALPSICPASFRDRVHLSAMRVYQAFRALLEAYLAKASLILMKATRDSRHYCGSHSLQLRANDFS
jgi:hypothetical protein